MSRGKYSPAFKRDMELLYNAYGDIPPEYAVGRDTFDERLHVANYESEGYDWYGYSGYDADGNYVGCGNGVDRNGYTEMDYLRMSDEDFEWACR